METLIENLEWTTVVLSFIAAFGLGWLWYSPLLFAERWAREAGIIMSNASGSMVKAMTTQAIGTFALAVVIHMAMLGDDVLYATLITLTIAILIKANGLFKQMSTYVVAVESGFILAMGALMILINMWL